MCYDIQGTKEDQKGEVSCLQKLEEMIRVGAEVEKNIKNVVDVISNCA